jgi:hypothetical protein
MKLVCSVYDTKAKLWSTPFFSHSAVVATRDFAAAAKGQGGIAQFPADYELWSIGEWHEETGIFVPFSPFNYLVRGDDFTQEA